MPTRRVHKPIPLACRLPRPLARIYWGWCIVAHWLVVRTPLWLPDWTWRWMLPDAGVYGYSDDFEDWFTRCRAWRARGGFLE